MSNGDTLRTNSNPEPWENVHKNFSQPIERFSDIRPPRDSASDIDAGLRKTTSDLQTLISNASADNLHLRAFGGGWSLSKVAATNGCLLNTKRLNLNRCVASEDISPNYTGDRRQLYLAQCGMSIKELNLTLETYSRSLKASGASNGQTIVGAMSTCTHGSAFDFGPIPNFVVGLHVIVSPDRHVWLERASRPVVSDHFIQSLDTQLIQDDTIFNAALVSFGSFGIIHAVMIETEPLYLLEANRKRSSFDDSTRDALKRLDLPNLPVQYPDERPYHFEVTMIPKYRNDAVLYTSMYKRTYDPDRRSPPNRNPIEMGDDALGTLGGITDNARWLARLLSAGFAKNNYKPYRNKIGTLGDIFTDTDVKGKATSMSVAVPLHYASEALDRVLYVHDQEGPFPGVIVMRFVKRCEALLAQTKFDTTCVIDLEGAQSNRSTEIFKKLWCELDGNIPFTLHWGKINDWLNPDRVRDMYGSKVDQWIASRHQLLDSATRKIFSNEFLKKVGLDL